MTGVRSSPILGAEHLERRGEELARSHVPRHGGGHDVLVRKLAADERAVLEAANLLARADARTRRLTPAGEWLLDNLPLVEEHVRAARDHLSTLEPGALPELVSGPGAGLPRVYELAREAVVAGDGRVEDTTLARLIAAYRPALPLSLTELWAVPCALRVALVGRIAEVCGRLLEDRRDAGIADTWADRMTSLADSDPKSVVVAVADMARQEPPMSSAFVAEMARRLHGRGTALNQALAWIEQWLAEAGATVEDMVHDQHVKQAADQVAISHCIGSLRTVTAIDWDLFVEAASDVERVLRLDPAGVHARMDFATRERYRRVVADLSERSHHGEAEIAHHAVRLATEAGDRGDALRSHVGFWLVDEGEAVLETLVGARVTRRARLRRATARLAMPLFLAGVALATTVLTAVLLIGQPTWLAILLVLPTIVVAGELAVSVSEWLLAQGEAPRLPRLDLSDGIPADHRTLVVVSTVAGSEVEVDALVSAMEVRFLANRDPHLHFALITDFDDAREEILPGDRALLDHARGAISALRSRHGDFPDAFLLLHRPRRWDERDKVWRGAGRERGQLADLHALIRGRGEHLFLLRVGNEGVLAGVAHVLALDPDTSLPRDAARDLISAAAHPLVRPVLDPERGRFVRGYGVLQPAVGAGFPTRRTTRYARWMGPEPGLAGERRLGTDPYQVLFAESSSLGRGLYAVDALELVAGDRADSGPPWHDLLASAAARTAAVGDVTLFEEPPRDYATDALRWHRRIRWDWQALSWLLPGSGGRRLGLTPLSRWTLTNHLRRSLEPAALVALLLATWTLSPRPGWRSAALLVLPVLPSVLAVSTALLRRPRQRMPRAHRLAVLAVARRWAMRLVLALSWLPHQAFVALDAVVRTIPRVASRRRLLTWTPSSEVHASDLRHLWTLEESMSWVPTLAASVAVLLLFLRPEALPVALPVLALWFAAPWLLRWTARVPELRRDERVDAGETALLRRLARRTWGFFEAHVGPADRWLPPDNVQEEPVFRIAHRTSPTNIGLSLLSGLAAHDLGYLSTGRLVERTDGALRTLGELERYRGHLLNWYDTLSGAPLEPRYVSSVDSGNLAGHLLVLRQGLLELSDAPLLPPRTFDGLADALDLVRETAPAAPCDRLRVLIEAARAHPPATVPAVREKLGAVVELGDEVRATLPVEGEAAGWAAALVAQARDLLVDLRLAGERVGMPTLRELAAAGVREASSFVTRLEALAAAAGELAEMDFAFLLDPRRKLLSVGWSVTEGRLDAACYDLLASEARLATFVGISLGQLPQRCWFDLGRPHTLVEGEPALLSWSGSMFEYLMPRLVMPVFEGTLLDLTIRAAVVRQRAWGTQRKVPWGVSESGYHAVDASSNYQYRAFGVPGLGLKRGLGDDLVVAPYATALALTADPAGSVRNLGRLLAEGFGGRFGLYEAVDYTPARVPQGRPYAVVRSFMAHHQGMALLAFEHVLLDAPMHRRFLADPRLRASSTLLHERAPLTAPFHPHPSEVAGLELPPEAGFTSAVRVVSAPDPLLPEVQLLSNGRYHVLLSSAGGGTSRLGDVVLTRWRPDPTRDVRGFFVYLRDPSTGLRWSATHQPTAVPVDEARVTLSDSKVEFRSRKDGVEATLEVVVSPEDDVEVRRLRLVSRGRRRTIEVTTFAEVVLASQGGDELHPGFGNLFVQTSVRPERRAIVCTRRPRGPGDPSPCLFHLLSAPDAAVREVSFETDRERFLGRTGDASSPAALAPGGPPTLSGTQGAVLDPMVAVRARVTLEPDVAVVLDFVLGATLDPATAEALVDRYQDRAPCDRVFDLAWTHAQVVRRQVHASAADAVLYDRLAGLVVHPNAAFRAEPKVLLENRRAQSNLWGLGLSGDLPIVVLEVVDPARLRLAEHLARAHAWWRIKGLLVDLVIIVDEPQGYRQGLRDEVMAMVAGGLEAKVLDKPGGVHVVVAQQLAHEDVVLLEAAAAVLLRDGDGTLAEQLERRPTPPRLPRLVSKAQWTAWDLPRVRPVVEAVAPYLRGGEGTLLACDLGGFTPDGSEYVIDLHERRTTPAPWSNVLANPRLGTVLTESCLGYTWSDNAQLLRLSPWHDDPVTDASGEALWLRDDELGTSWSPTPLPRRGSGAYRVRHGFGYSVFEHAELGIASELWVFVDPQDAVKYAVLRLRNGSGRPRQLTAMVYVEWVLGDRRSKTAQYLVTSVDAGSRALLARNPWHPDLPAHTAFLQVDDPTRTVTGDRSEFLGRNGTLASPAALTASRLSGRVGPALDPCGALALRLRLEDGEGRDLVFALGAGRDPTEAATVARSIGPVRAREALATTRRQWKDRVSVFRVRTPDPALDVLVNGWLVVQTLASRVYGRSGYHQSGGAYGFRDQLQDLMAMVHVAPELLREHLLRAAAHQFVEGDVLHWWHPPTGRGVRTRCSDDLLWLPLAVARYVEATGDVYVLGEVAPYVVGRPLDPGQESHYDLPMRSTVVESLYDHCVRALRLVFERTGARGLPLMGSGDWNDGMNLVGIEGRGESVWLGFFLAHVVEAFSAVATRRGDEALVTELRERRAGLARQLEAHAWDGAWYLRAWFDDGTPLGGASATEARIDSISQSWAVLSGVAEPARARSAMDALDELLVRRDAGIIQLLDPPFDKGTHEPGYIKGYVPGVRENGGQYTHAAVWAAMAFARLGDTERAWELTRMVLPPYHTLDPQRLATWRVEPYVLAADVLSVPPHTGRGGWTWYTGSAGWLFRLLVEELLGVKVSGDRLEVKPRIPRGWDGFEVELRLKGGLHKVRVKRGERAGVWLDGAEVEEIRLTAGEHEVVVVLGPE